VARRRRTSDLGQRRAEAEASIDVVGLGRDRVLEVGQRGGGATGAKQRQSGVRRERGARRPQRGGALEVGDRAGQVAAVAEGDAVPGVAPQ